MGDATQEIIERIAVESPYINWNEHIQRRPDVMREHSDMPDYLLKPEINRLRMRESHPTYRLIIDLMWATGARISELLQIVSSDFVQEKFGYSLDVRSVRTHAVVESNTLGRVINIYDPSLVERVRTYISANQLGPDDEMFSMSRQNVNLHISGLVNQDDSIPFSVSANTIRHSFAVNCLLHGLPLVVVRDLLGHSSTKSTEIYSSVIDYNNEHGLRAVSID